MKQLTRYTHAARCSLTLAVVTIGLAGGLPGQVLTQEIEREPPTPGNPVPEFDSWLLLIIGGAAICAAHRWHSRRSRTV